MDNIVDTEVKKSRFWWLRRNNLFETTTLTGYGFINDAKRTIEAVVWYGLLLIFTVFTVNNIHNLIVRYNSKPTKTDVRIASNALDATIKNFTLKLKLPIAELDQSRLVWWHFGMPFLCGHYFESVEDASLHASSCLPVSLHPLVKNYDTEMGEFLVNFGKTADVGECQMPEQINKSTIIVDTQQSLDKLEARYSQDLTVAWEKTGMRSIFKEQKDAQSSIIEACYYFREIYKREKPKYFTPFLLLSAMSDHSIKNHLPFLSVLNASKFFEVEGLSPKEIVNEITQRLFNIAPFQLPPELGETKLVLHDWSIEFSSKKTNLGLGPKTPIPFKPGYDVFGESFTLEYLVLVPPDIKEFKMDIFPPKQLIDALFVIMHLDKYLFEIRKRNFYHKSHRLYFEEHPRLAYLESYFYPLLDLYLQHTELILETGSGYIKMEPFASYHIKYVPIGRITSQIDECTSMGFTECLDLCQGNFTLSTCKCYPWQLHYLYAQLDNETCLQPCPGFRANIAQCMLDCEAKLSHPCDHYIYRPEIITKSSNRKSLEDASDIKEFGEKYSYALTNDFKLFTINIDVEKVFTYPKIFESYEMSFTTFISEFGASGQQSNVKDEDDKQMDELNKHFETLKSREKKAEKQRSEQLLHLKALLAKHSQQIAEETEKCARLSSRNVEKQQHVKCTNQAL